jgi:hypothetical protein
MRLGDRQIRSLTQASITPKIRLLALWDELFRAVQRDRH